MNASSKCAAKPWRCSARRVALASLLAIVAGVAHGESLSFNDALDLALREAPVLTANAAQVLSLIHI